MFFKLKNLEKISTSIQKCYHKKINSDTDIVIKSKPCIQSMKIFKYRSVFKY